MNSGYACLTDEKKTGGVTWIRNSSHNSRRKHSTNDSRSCFFPPGNSQKPPNGLPSSLFVNRTWPPLSIIAAATTVVGRSCIKASSPQSGNGSTEILHGTDRAFGGSCHADRRPKIHEGLIKIVGPSAWNKVFGYFP